MKPGVKIRPACCLLGSVLVIDILMLVAARAGIGLPVVGAAGEKGLAAAILEDVDFTARGPLNLVRVQPECRPHALRCGQVDAGLEPPGTVQACEVINPERYCLLPKG